MLTKKIIYCVCLFVLISLQLAAQTITLRDTTNRFDYIIITIPEFVSVCEPFKQHKESFRNFETLIVDTTQIFAEFDSSSTPQDNIRDFISYAGTFWSDPKPEYFLFVGNLVSLPNFPDIFDWGPYLDTAYTDFKYVVNKYGADTTLAYFKLGRVPATTETEVTDYFNKVILFELGTIYESWMNNNLFVYHEFHDTNFSFIYEDVAKLIMDGYPEYFVNYQYYAENDTSPYFGNKDSVINFLNTKYATALWLIGRTSNTQFGNSNILDTGDVALINNGTKNFITIFYQRQNFSSDIIEKGLADKFLLDVEAAIAVVAPVGIVISVQQETLLQELSQELFGIERKSIGEAINNSRNIFSTSYVKRILNLWGDPSLFPKYDSTLPVNDIPESVPSEFVLFQNYPNPFNPSTKIKYAIPQTRVVSLIVYNILGKEITTLINEEKPAGEYEVEFDATTLTSGIYFYRLQAVPTGRQAGSFVETKKMVLMK